MEVKAERLSVTLNSIWSFIAPFIVNQCDGGVK